MFWVSLEFFPETDGWSRQRRFLNFGLRQAVQWLGLLDFESAVALGKADPFPGRVKLISSRDLLVRPND